MLLLLVTRLFVNYYSLVNYEKDYYVKANPFNCVLKEKDKILQQVVSIITSAMNI